MAYQMSKTALNSATKNMANSLKGKNIIAISIDPGWVKTDMGGETAILMPYESVSGMRNIVGNFPCQIRENSSDMMEIYYHGKKIRHISRRIPPKTMLYPYSSTNLLIPISKDLAR